MNDISNSLVKQFELLEDQHDILAVRIGRIEDANRDLIPGEIVHRLSDGEPPVLVWREHCGLSRPDLATAAALDEAVLAAWEQGKEPPLRDVARVARILGADMEELVPWPQD